MSKSQSYSNFLFVLLSPSEAIPIFLVEKGRFPVSNLPLYPSEIAP